MLNVFRVSVYFDLVVPSPVEDYFLYNDDLPYPEKVTISYVDEDLPFEERQALLADYGFKCRCPKCLEEAITNEAALNTINVEEVMRFVKGMIDELNLVGPFIILMFNYATFVKFKIESVIGSI
ncbi:hypothetical protein L3X38_019645 [Prunus dulcis]|uniref:Uncharacterized protein n=1 Tax=Prunus dulcis TaxID=3755 RepID=A0AAD4ZC92_PRUDU|nr:hypothetical protein L3X38_019645 [Prunus dulcis]